MHYVSHYMIPLFDRQLEYLILSKYCSKYFFCFDLFIVHITALSPREETPTYWRVLERSKLAVVLMRIRLSTLFRKLCILILSKRSYLLSGFAQGLKIQVTQNVVTAMWMFGINNSNYTYHI